MLKGYECSRHFKANRISYPVMFGSYGSRKNVWFLHIPTVNVYQLSVPRAEHTKGLFANKSQKNYKATIPSPITH